MMPTFSNIAAVSLVLPIATAETESYSASAAGLARETRFDASVETVALFCATQPQRSPSWFDKAVNQILDPQSLLNRLREVAFREPMALVIGLHLLCSKASFMAVMGTVVPSSSYADLADRAIGGDHSAMTELKKEIDDNPLGVIPYIARVAEAGHIDAWECLWKAMKSNEEPVRELAVDALRDTPLSPLVDKVRGDLDTKSINAQRTVNILKMLFATIGRPAALSELETWGNERVRVVLRDFSYQRLPGAQEAYQKWLQSNQRPPDEMPIVVASNPRKPRRDSTEIGIPTISRPPKPPNSKK